MCATIWSDSKSWVRSENINWRAKYGPQYDMFVVDAWAFGTAAKDINSNGSDEYTQRIAKAITLQNVATASVLGHGSLNIIPVA